MRRRSGRSPRASILARRTVRGSGIPVPLAEPGRLERAPHLSHRGTPPHTRTELVRVCVFAPLVAVRWPKSESIVFRKMSACATESHVASPMGGSGRALGPQEDVATRLPNCLSVGRSRLGRVWRQVLRGHRLRLPPQHPRPESWRIGTTLKFGEAPRWVSLRHSHAPPSPNPKFLHSQKLLVSWRGTKVSWFEDMRNRSMSCGRVLPPLYRAPRSQPDPPVCFPKPGVSDSPLGWGGGRREASRGRGGQLEGFQLEVDRGSLGAARSRERGFVRSSTPHLALGCGLGRSLALSWRHCCVASLLHSSCAPLLR